MNISNKQCPTKTRTLGRVKERGNIHPKKRFQIDGFGAIPSAIPLGIVLAKWGRIFGIPKPTLFFLATLPGLFAIYDFYCYFRIDKNPGIFLKGIAITNLIYCCLSIDWAIYHRNENH
ncbi:MAG: hypothetical protein AB3N16_05400 [Flavobacteriaceae bacterium]